MTSQNRFPKQLLTAPVTARLDYFRHKIVAHPQVQQVYEQLIETINQPVEASIIFVYGPTGVGKTTLLRRIEKRLIEQALPELAQDPGRIPVISLEAIAHGAENFNWKDFYKRGLLAVDEPLVQAKVEYHTRHIRRNTEGQLVIEQRVTPSELRQAFEQCIQHRQPLALMVDEAQHLKKMSGGRRLLDQMDSVKSLASLTETVYVLLGTYEVLGLTALSAQLCRRSVEIHFPRYRLDQAKDVAAFKSAILTFQRHLPLAEEPDLVANYEYLYEGSVGCIGILKDWLTRALSAALKKNEKTLKLEDLEQHVEPLRNLLRMAREIKEGEELLLERTEQRLELRALLGLHPASGTEQPATKPQRKRVAERNPVRDRVGAP